MIPARLVERAYFDIELEFTAPVGFWEEEPELPYLDPEQKYFWKRAIPERPEEGWTWQDEWLRDLHEGLRKRGWPDEYTEALYSYSDPNAVDGGIHNPYEGEEVDPDRTPIVSFRIGIPGDWLAAHPEFLKDLKKLSRTGIWVKVKGRREKAHLDYWRIYADGGDLDGMTLESSIFLVRPRRKPPGAFEGGPRDWFPD